MDAVDRVVLEFWLLVMAVPAAASALSTEIEDVDSPVLLV